MGICQNGANGIANSEDPDQTAPLGGTATLDSFLTSVFQYP